VSPISKPMAPHPFRLLRLRASADDMLDGLPAPQ
jgi:hypothetical protein